MPFSVREEASQLFREAQDANLIRGRSIETFTAGCVYAACRRRGQNRSVQEIADVARCPTEKVWLGYRILSRDLDLATGLVRPVDLLPKFADEADVPKQVERRAFELAEHAEHEGIANGRSPSGVAAACLYLAAQETGFILTQERLEEIAGVTVLTIRARYQELRGER
ncbi:transcription initiation factor IIB [Halospeciosus flavus]|uniref:transcription initiation factor IIB n=1 Tax=Halospeciosus flavus TaxID=3032283 RepID=UPI00361F0876